MKTQDVDMRSKIIKIIKESGCSLAKIERLSGIKDSTLCNWMYADVMPSVDKAEAVLNALGYRIDINSDKILNEEASCNENKA